MKIDGKLLDAAIDSIDIGADRSEEASLALESAFGYSDKGSFRASLLYNLIGILDGKKDKELIRDVLRRLGDEIEG